MSACTGLWDSIARAYRAIGYHGWRRVARRMLRKARHLGPRVLIDAALYQLHMGKREALSYPPRHITPSVGGYCTNRCLFCAYHCPDSQKSQETSHLSGLDYRISYEDFCRIIDMAREARVPFVHICAAGEPFLHEDMFRMMDYVIERFGDVSTQTNFNRPLYEKRGILPRIIERGNAISYITTDICGPTADRHNAVKVGSDFDFLLDCMSEISQRTRVELQVTYILTKDTYQGIPSLLELLHERRIACHITFLNLDPYGFNDFTDPSKVYTSADTEITRELEEVAGTARRLKFPVQIPLPVDRQEQGGGCFVFWQQLQFAPSRSSPEANSPTNAFPRACVANARGGLASLGDLFDYPTLMDLWNNDKLRAIRRDLMNGVYPDDMCTGCPCYDGSRLL